MTRPRRLIIDVVGKELFKINPLSEAKCKTRETEGRMLKQYNALMRQVCAVAESTANFVLLARQTARFLVIDESLSGLVSPQNGTDEFQQQLLQWVGVAKGSPGVFELLMVGIDVHAPGRCLEVASFE